MLALLTQHQPHEKKILRMGCVALTGGGCCCSLRATFDNPEYEKLVSYWIGEKYTLRYTGGMVPDVFQIIVKEKVQPVPTQSTQTTVTPAVCLAQAFTVQTMSQLVGCCLIMDDHPQAWCTWSNHYRST